MAGGCCWRSLSPLQAQGYAGLTTCHLLSASTTAFTAKRYSLEIATCAEKKGYS